MPDTPEDVALKVSRALSEKKPVSVMLHLECKAKQYLSPRMYHLRMESEEAAIRKIRELKENPDIVWFNYEIHSVLKEDTP